MTPDQIEAQIKEKLPNAIVQVTDLTGGGDHYQATIVSELFNGKRRVQQHQMIYAALNEAMSSEAIHALALNTYTPIEWKEAGH